jgi:hypothetical protein
MSIRANLEGKDFPTMPPFIDALSAGVNEEIQAAIQPFQAQIAELQGTVAALQQEVIALGGAVSGLSGQIDEIGSRQPPPEVTSEPTPTPQPTPEPTTTPATVPGSGTGAVGPTGIIPNVGDDDLSPVGPITVSIPGASVTPPDSPPDDPTQFTVGPFPWVWNPDLQRWVNTFITT